MLPVQNEHVYYIHTPGKRQPHTVSKLTFLKNKNCLLIKSKQFYIEFSILP